MLNPFRYILKSLLHYTKLNLATTLGIALSTAILVGALIIGDSVKYSLQQITSERLGQTDAVITAGERLFTTDLSENIARNQHRATASVLRANGIAIVDGGQVRVNQLQVWGIDPHFAEFSQAPSVFSLSGNEVLINENLARILNIGVGDEWMLRVNKLSAFPSNTPFVSAEETSIAFRVKVKAVVGALQTGNFNLQNIQSAPRNVFIDINWLNRQLELTNKANVILLKGDAHDSLDSLLKGNVSLADYSLKLRTNQQLAYSELISDRVFIADETVDTCKNIEGAEPVFSYFVNDFILKGKETPYSFVSSLNSGIKGNELIINQWLADDLKARVGDSILVKYFKVGTLRQLVGCDTLLVVKQIVPLTGKWADLNRMPEIPGLSDAGHCRDWETGVPVDLNKVRPTDEAYWNKYKGTPKAYVSLDLAQNIWKNRFGNATAVRFPEQDSLLLSNRILSLVQPSEIGFQLEQVKTNGMYAASNGVDFGGLFIGLSFFVLIAAILLTVLLFQLYLGFRRYEIGTLSALGFSVRQVKKLFLAESMVIVALGIVLGIPFGIGYNWVILQAINSIWVDIVRTSIVYIHIRFVSVLLGAFAVFLLSFVFIYFITGSFLKQTIVGLQKKQQLDVTPKLLYTWIGAILVMSALLLVFAGGFRKGEINPEQFFISGFLFMPGIILLFNRLLYVVGTRFSKSGFSLRNFIVKRIAGNRRQNIMIISFLSIGIFLVVSTGVNRKNLAKDADQNFSGTGGYQVFAETTIPVSEDLNNPEVATEYGLSSDMELVQFRIKAGDDASCLNLNRIARPRMIGFDPTSFDKRKSFTFITRSDDLDEEHPWLSLQRKTADGFVPAIADQTVILWGLGKKVGDTLVYVNEKGEDLKLKLIGGLANSVFQGNILVDEQFFIQNYPSVSGSSMFLADSKKMDSKLLEDELAKGLRTYGVDTIPVVKRLLQFYKIEDTYLNIFLMLGALGLLIGTVGLGILLFRTITEKSSEYALLLSLGFRKKTIYRFIFTENLLIVFIAVLAGLLPSVISAIPSATTEIYRNLMWWPFMISLLVLLSAVVFMVISIRMAIRKNLVEQLRNE